MSIKTWKEEFYPKPASSRMSKKTAIQSSWVKWIGLLPANLKKHAVRKSLYLNEIESIEYGRKFFYVDTSTCALCAKYLNWVGESEAEECGKCPLYQLLGASCDSGEKSPYQIWCDTGNPRPMIKALKKLLDKAEE